MNLIKARKAVALAIAPVAALAAIAIPTTTHAQDSAFFYCSLAKSPYGNPTFYSSIFRADSQTYSRAMENSFNSYVSGQYDSDAISGAICFGPFYDYQDAADNQNDAIGATRRNGTRTVLTNWVFYGN